MQSFRMQQNCTSQPPVQASLSTGACVQVVQEVKLSISDEDLKSLKAAMQNKPRAAVQDPGLIGVRSCMWPANVLRMLCALCNHLHLDRAVRGCSSAGDP